MKYYYIDIETTGLEYPQHEIIEIAIINDDGETVFHSLFRPQCNTCEGSSHITGISDEMVKNAPKWDDLKSQVCALLDGAVVIIFNSAFDAQFLGSALYKSKVICAMKLFSRLYGEWSEKYKNWKWQSLRTAVQHITGESYHTAHRAEPDAMDCRTVFNWCIDKMIENDAAGAENRRKNINATFFKRWKGAHFPDADPITPQRIATFRQMMGCEDIESVFQGIMAGALPYDPPKGGFIAYFDRVRNAKRIPIFVTNDPTSGCQFYRLWKNQFGGGTSKYYLVGNFQSEKTGHFAVTESDFKAFKRLNKLLQGVQKN
jgi:DNA polymerase III subunit epsilon